MYLKLSAIVKDAKYTPANTAENRSASTKIKMFEIGGESGADVELKFPGQVIFAPGIPVTIEGEFRMTKYLTYTIITAVTDMYDIKQIGHIVFDDQGDKKEKKA